MKLTIGQRILIGLGIVELLGLGLSVSLLYSLWNLRRLDLLVKERDFAILRALTELHIKQGELKASRERLLGLYLLQKADPKDWPAEARDDPAPARKLWRQGHDETQEQLKAIQKLAETYAPIATSARRKGLWEQIARNAADGEQARQALAESAEKLLELLAKGNLSQAPALARSVDDRRRAFDRLLVEGTDLTRQQIAAGSELSAETYGSAWLWALVGLGLMLALGLTVGLLIWRSVTRPLGEFRGFVERVGQGDLTGRTPASNVTDLEHLGQSLDRMVGGLRELSGEVVRVSHDLNAASAEILASVQEQAAATRQQAASVQEITATVEEISRSGRQIAERAQQVASAAEATASASTAGIQAVGRANRSMEGVRLQVETFAGHIVALSEKTQQVGEIITAVTDLAERSNLLALNAAIEAAGLQAGATPEQGSRFAVVASEMKSLADQAKEATRQVQSILGAIQKGIHSSVMLTEEAVKRAEAGKEQTEATEGVIRQLAEVTQTSVQAFQQIIAGTNQQHIGLDQVTQGMQEIRQAVAQTASATAQLEKAMVNVSGLGQQLQKALGRYRL